MTQKSLWLRLRALVRWGAVEQDLDEEIRYHLEREVEKLMADGVDRVEAHRRALVVFGGVEKTKEAHRDGRGVRWVRDLAGDARYALRTLRRNPTLSGAAILTLALGIGANTAIFSAVNGVLLRPLPFPEPDRLVTLWEDNPEMNWKGQSSAPANMLDWKERVGGLEDVAGFLEFRSSATLTGRGEPQLLNAIEVTGNFFSVLGARAVLGRTLEDAETWGNANPVAVVSHRAWKERLGGSTDIIGKTITLDGRSVQVVGVMPPSFAFPEPDLDIWRPVAWDKNDRAQVWFRRAHFVRPIGRLKPGATIESAQAELNSVAAQLQREYPATNKTMFAGLGPLHDFLVGSTKTPLLVLISATAFLLLIACANVANLMLVRASAREREIVLRRALGAGDLRVVRQALTESLVLSGIGGAAGAFLGWWGTRVLVALQPPGLFNTADVRADWRVFLFVLALTVLSGILFGVGPALWNRRRSPSDVLREGARGTSEGRRLRIWGSALVVSEVAIALVLSIGAGLLARSFWKLTNESPGFEVEGVLAAGVQIPGARYDTPEKVIGFYDQLAQRARSMPGVESAALVSLVPLTTESWTSSFSIAGRPPEQYGREVVHREITADYFRTMRVPLLAGRTFTNADRHGSEPVIILNQALAEQYFKGENPIGQRICFDKAPDSTSLWRTVVGVVGNEHQSTLALEPRIEIFAPFAQEERRGMSLLLRTRGNPAAFAEPTRRVLAQLDPALALQSVQTMTDIRRASMARERFFTTLLFLFASFGVVLAVVGVYGVMAQLSLRRAREMGIRIALGAGAGSVRWLIVRQGLELLGVGVLAGALTAALTTTGMEKLLFRVPARDATTFLVTSFLLIGTGVLASWLPAARATRADPAEVLRRDG